MKTATELETELATVKEELRREKLAHEATRRISGAAVESLQETVDVMAERAKARGGQ